MAEPYKVRAEDKGREFMVISLKSSVTHALTIVFTIVATVLSGAFGIWSFLENEINTASDARDQTLRALVSTVTNDVSRLSSFVETNAKADEIIRSDMGSIKSDIRSLVEQQSRQLEITREESLRVNDLEAYIRNRLNEIAVAMTQSDAGFNYHAKNEHNNLNTEIEELKSLITNEITQRNLMERDISELERLLDQANRTQQ